MQALGRIAVRVTVMAAVAARLAPAEPSRRLPAGHAPWSVAAEHPVVAATGRGGVQTAGTVSQATVSMAAFPLLAAVSAYQRWGSGLWPGSCPMHPSCSRYAIESVRAYGAGIGALLVVDRLFREGDAWRYAPSTVINGRRFLLDPPCRHHPWLPSCDLALLP